MIERYFDMIFDFKVAEHLVAEHYERDFDMISRFMVAQNLVVAKHYERGYVDMPRSYGDEHKKVQSS